MKYVFNRQYLYYVLFALGILALPLLFSPKSSKELLLFTLLPALISWIIYLEYRRRHHINVLQLSVNKLANRQKIQLARQMNLSLHALNDLSNVHLTHQQMLKLKHFLTQED